MSAESVPPAAKQLTVIEPRKGLPAPGLRQIWEHRELLCFLAWRDVRVRYRQTALGVGWAVLQPLVTVVVFTVVFGTLARVPSDGLPYPLFAYAALLPWLCFSQTLSRAALSLVTSTQLVQKVYFPRLVIPVAAAAVPLVDFLVSALVFVAVLVAWGFDPSPRILALPVFLGLAVITALAAALWLAPLHARYRDVGHGIPFLMQAWMYLSPVVYPTSLVPEGWQGIYQVNPLVPVVDGFRWALLGAPAPSGLAVALSAGAALLVALAGAVQFRRAEGRLADVI